MAVKLLLVDDSAIMRKMVVRAIRQYGLDVDTADEAGNGVEALDILSQKTVDLVICDWNMPEMDGITFVRQARADKNTTRILMLSTESSGDRIAEALAAGADGYLTKPFTPERLGKKIDIVLAS